MLSLPLFVLLIRTNHPHDAAAPHDLAFVANPFHRCSNLHSFSTIRPLVTSLLISIRTRSPTRIRTKLRSIRSAMCAVTLPPSSSFTRYSALGSASVTTPVIAAPRPVLRAQSEPGDRPPSPPPYARSAPTGCRRASPPSSRPPAPSPPACPR